MKGHIFLVWQSPRASDAHESSDKLEVGDEGFCQRVVEHRLTTVVLLLQLGQLATLLFTTATTYQLTGYYKA